MPTISNSRKPWIPKAKQRKENKSWFGDPRYHTTQWRNYRQSFLALNPLCVDCKRVGRIRPASLVGHIIPVSKDLSNENFWNTKNHKALCKSCNSRQINKDKQMTNGCRPQDTRH